MKQSNRFSRNQFRVMAGIGTIFFLCSFQPAIGEEASSSRNITFQEYFQAIERNSTDLEGQRQNIVAAQGGVSMARIRPDPEFTGGIDSKELASGNKPNASLVTLCEVGVTLETAGKRRKRIRLARSGVKLAEGNTRLFCRQLKSDAASAFIAACHLKEAFKRKKSSLEGYLELVRANEARLRAGDIGALELQQSRVEADRFKTDLDLAKAEAREALEMLSVPLSRRFDEIFPGGDIDSHIDISPLPQTLDELIQRACANDEEIRVARISIDAARDALELERANRSVDPTISAGLTNSPRVGERLDTAGNMTNSPAPRSLTLGMTVSVPIPLSRRERGSLIQAEAALKQAELQLASTRVKIETEMRGGFTKYQATLSTVRQYLEHILKEADQVCEGVRKGYRMGESSLLELLEAQRTADDVYLGYLQALAVFADSKVKLQILAGIPADL